MRASCETCCVFVLSLHCLYLHGMHVAGKAVMLESLPDGSEVAESSTGVGTSEPARVSKSDFAAGSKRRRAAKPRPAPPAMLKTQMATEVVEISDDDNDFEPVVKVLRP